MKRPLKALLLVFSENLGSREIVTNYLTTLPSISNWYAIFQNAIFIVSDTPVQHLSEVLRNRFPNVWFILTEVNPERTDGLLPPSNWHFILNPAPAEAAVPAPYPQTFESALERALQRIRFERAVDDVRNTLNKTSDRRPDDSE